jgi:hypothetical protein
MSLNPALIMASAEAEGEAAISAYAVGAITLVILLALLIGVIAFGGGREHS